MIHDVGDDHCREERDKGRNPHFLLCFFVRHDVASAHPGVTEDFRVEPDHAQNHVHDARDEDGEKGDFKHRNNSRLQ